MTNAFGLINTGIDAITIPDPSTESLYTWLFGPSDDFVQQFVLRMYMPCLPRLYGMVLFGLTESLEK